MVEGPRAAAGVDVRLQHGHVQPGLRHEVIPILEIISKKGNQNSLSDAGVAIAVIAAASEGAFLNVLINYSSLTEKQKAAELLIQAENLNNEVKEEAQFLLSEIKRKIRGN